MNRYLARASYLVGLTLIIIPLFDATMSVLPMRFGDSRWRYGTIGLLSNALLIPVAGMLIVFVAASVLEHRRMARILGVFAWLGSLVCAIAFVAFLLDALQSQSQIRPDMHLSFIVATSTAGFKLLLGALTFGMFGVAGFKDKTVVSKPLTRTSVLIPDAKAQSGVVTSRT